MKILLAQMLVGQDFLQVRRFFPVSNISLDGPCSFVLSSGRWTMSPLEAAVRNNRHTPPEESKSISK
jgi:hypothetical protein